MVNCEYCGGDIETRNPTGKCDHLYYPENVNKQIVIDGKEIELSNESYQELKKSLLN